MDVVAFLKARLDEDEAEYPRNYSHRCYGDIWLPEYYDERVGDMVKNAHPCRHQREVQAKRELLSWVVARWSAWPDDCDMFLNILASIYSDHPDYPF